MPTVDLDRLLEPYVQAPTTAAAEAALDRLADVGEIPCQDLGDCYDELAEHAANDGDMRLAARLERKAIDAGCRQRWVAREMLGWYLLESGSLNEGESLFDELRRERPGDVELVVTLGHARSAAGMSDAALAAFDEAVAVARLQGTASELDRARIERRAEREAAGLPTDADDRLAPARRPLPPSVVELAVAWFPAHQRDAALARWPGLADDFADPAGYCRIVERRLREIRRLTGHRPSVSPVDVDGLSAWAAEQDLDPDDGIARSGYAAELARTGRALPWPPERNAPCWCGSGTKYKRCCGGA